MAGLHQAPLAVGQRGSHCQPAGCCTAKAEDGRHRAGGQRKAPRLRFKVKRIYRKRSQTGARLVEDSEVRLREASRRGPAGIASSARMDGRACGMDPYVKSARSRWPHGVPQDSGPTFQQAAARDNGTLLVQDPQQRPTARCGGKVGTKVEARDLLGLQPHVVRVFALG